MRWVECVGGGGRSVSVVGWAPGADVMRMVAACCDRQ